MKIISLALAAATVAIAPGCGPEPRSFSPTERVEGRTIEGLKEAFYDVGTDTRLATVKVWSRGARPLDGATAIEVGFTVDNGSNRSIVFETGEARLDSVQTEHGTFARIASTSTAPVTIAPASSADLELTFVLPSGIAPDDVQAFRVRWTTSADGDRYVEFTPFVQDPELVFVPVYAYYEPFGPYWRRHAHVVIVRSHPRRVFVHPHHGR